MPYTYKMVNGVKITLNSADQAALAARDAADWANLQDAPPPETSVLHAPPPLNPCRVKLARLAAAFRLTVAELKTELTRP